LFVFGFVCFVTDTLVVHPSVSDTILCAWEWKRFDQLCKILLYPFGHLGRCMFWPDLDEMLIVRDPAKIYFTTRYSGW